MKNLRPLVCNLDFNQSERKSSQVHARSGQTESQGATSFQLASTFESVWPGLQELCLAMRIRAQVVYNNKLSDPFEIRTGVRKGCLTSPLLFSMVIDWITRKVVKNERTGIQWTLTEQLEDLDFADDVCLISEEKLSVNASKLGINVNIPKTKVLKVNAKVNSPISLGGEDIE